MSETRLSLRERKKESTRAAIKKEAFALFRRYGYERTTVEQIADAAMVSPSTFFRYFQNKESVLIEDLYPQEIVLAFDRQPAGIDLVQAMHRAVTEVFGGMPHDELEALRQRNKLLLATSELHAAYTGHLFELMTMIAESAAHRTKQSPLSLEVRTFAWVMQGVLTAASAYWTENPRTSLVESFDRAFEILQSDILQSSRLSD